MEDNVLTSQKRTISDTGKTAIVVLIIATMAAISSPAIFTHRALAQTLGNQVSGGGNGVMTCPNGSTGNVGSSFNAANTQTGQFISGGFLFQPLSGPGPIKQGSFTHATITQSGFVLTGTVTSDTLCGTAPGASVTLSGPCFPPPGAAGTFQFTASNGEKATISGNVECIIVNQPPPCPENTQGNNNCQGQNNNKQ